jgi:predicted RecA/RadA family phage recombinase
VAGVTEREAEAVLDWRLLLTFSVPLIQAASASSISRSRRLDLEEELFFSFLPKLKNEDLRAGLATAWSSCEEAAASEDGPRLLVCDEDEGTPEPRFLASG